MELVLSASGWNMYVFRDGKRAISGVELLDELQRSLRCWQECSPDIAEDNALAALVAAGELECALLDDAASAPTSREFAAELTESIAAAFVSREPRPSPLISESATRVAADGSYLAAVQEGFAFYALHPRKVAMLLDELPLAPEMAVLGIRSIGVTLSAVACAALRRKGIRCRRINVRPVGHPYGRVLELTDELRRWVADAGDAGFLIVDEGPGISGSSFLAVAEMLVACGVEQQRITSIGSRQADPATLRAPDAATRWPRYNFRIMQSAPILPAGVGESLSGGTWRRRFAASGSEIPACWAALEPAKFLSLDQQTIFRFEGFGHYGREVGDRARLLAAHGFSPAYLGNRAGFGEYELVEGEKLSRGDLSPELVERIADYLALRAREFASAQQQSPELGAMLRWNWQVEFGERLDPVESTLHCERAVICDGRMMPREWLRTTQGTLLKLDATSHGDNHFFPGPCDIAWDVAGAIIEWELPVVARKRLIDAYHARTGDRIRPRLAPYLLAYTIFQLGWCKMAALAMQGEFDEGLLERDYRRYRQMAVGLRNVVKAA